MKTTPKKQIENALTNDGLEVIDIQESKEKLDLPKYKDQVFNVLIVRYKKNKENTIKTLACIIEILNNKKTSHWRFENSFPIPREHFLVAEKLNIKQGIELTYLSLLFRDCCDFIPLTQETENWSRYIITKNQDEFFVIDKETKMENGHRQIHEKYFKQIATFKLSEFQKEEHQTPSTSPNKISYYLG